MQDGVDLLESFASIFSAKFGNKWMGRRGPKFRPPYLPCLSVFAFLCCVYGEKYGSQKSYHYYI
jgi:hypothetical protein